MKTILKSSTKELRTLSRFYLLEGLFIAGMFHFALIGGVNALMRHLNIDETIPTLVIDRPIDWIPVVGTNTPQHPAPTPTAPRPEAFVNNAMPTIVPGFIEEESDTLKHDVPPFTGTGEPGQGEPFGGSTSIAGTFIPGGSDEIEPSLFTAVEKDPIPILNPSPIYPEIARRACIEGTVFLKMWVTKDGRVKKAEIIKSASPIIDQAAVTAALSWKFTPAVMNGGPVSVWVTVPFRFRLNSN
ncbi:MAG: energy transducer TonB [Bacteroidota bacterium]